MDAKDTSFAIINTHFKLLEDKISALEKQNAELRARANTAEKRLDDLSTLIEVTHDNVKYVHSNTSELKYNVDKLTGRDCLLYLMANKSLCDKLSIDTELVENELAANFYAQLSKPEWLRRLLVDKELCARLSIDKELVENELARLSIDNGRVEDGVQRNIVAGFRARTRPASVHN